MSTALLIPEISAATEATAVSAEGVPDPSLAPLDFRDRRSTTADFDRIVQAAEGGSVRVVLGVPILFIPEGLLDSQGVGEQRRSIAAAQERILSDLARSGFEVPVLHRYLTLPYVVVLLSGRAAASLRRLDGVASAQLDRESDIDLAGTTPMIGATTALSRGLSGAGQTVAILDTGVDSTHSFLSGAVVAEACFGSCPNGTTLQFGPGSAIPLPAFIAGSSHGTHVAGIAAGRGVPNASFNGTAPGASIMAINVFHRVDNCFPNISPCARTWNSDAVAGLQHVFLSRAAFAFAAVNMSFGGGSSAVECAGSMYGAAVDNLRSVGVAAVAASGNLKLKAELSEPACVPGVISVGAVSKSDVVAQFSNSASFLKLLAPGVSVNSSVPGGFAVFDGTSMAAPHVTGSWALLKQRDPAAGVFAIQRALQRTGLPVIDFGNGIITPRIQVHRALATPAVFGHDFTRDRAADFAVWRPTTGDWWVNGLATIKWGQMGDVPVPGDYDGDGTTDLAVWRPATGEWWIRGQKTIVWGVKDDVPVPADYDGNGTIDIAVWRPATGDWWVRNQATTRWGESGDKPVPADYDGNGTADLAVWRPATGDWWVRNQGTTRWGESSDKPVPADYDGNGTADLAVWRPATGDWWVRNQGTTQWGASGDIPIPRDLGHGRAERTVWRSSTGAWLTLILIPEIPFNVQLTTAWGMKGDVPL